MLMNVLKDLHIPIRNGKVVKCYGRTSVPCSRTVIM